MTPRETDTATRNEVAATAAAVAPLWAQTTPLERARVLDGIADALDAAADQLIPTAMSETNLPEGRLRGELTRTTFQLRLFGEVLRDGAFVGVVIDHSDPGWPMGAPRPDLRRMNLPLGPVLVFAASNFPFAFSVAGGDTASALAAGCPVIVKANPGHTELSAQTFAVVEEALAEAGMPAGVCSIVYGFEAGTALVSDPRIQAGAFTGSLSAGRALFDLASTRPSPIPFFAEMGSVNPTIVTPGALACREDEIVAGYVTSITGSGGQLCTKPGILFAPAGTSMKEKLAAQLVASPVRLLNDRIAENFRQAVDALSSSSAVSTVASVPGNAVASSLLSVALHDALEDPEHYFTEVFGPASLIVEYENLDDVLAALPSLEGQLTATVFAEENEGGTGALLEALAHKAGRVLWNQWPTGLSVTWAQTHGGPYPATTAPSTTSVGTEAINRFLRPVTYQGVPEALLPDAVKDSNPLSLPRRVDGVRE